MDTVDTPSFCAFRGRVVLVAAQKKWRCRGSVRRLYLYKAFIPGRIERKNVISCPIPLFSRDPSNTARKIGPVGFQQILPLDVKDESLTALTNFWIPLGS